MLIYLRFGPLHFLPLRIDDAHGQLFENTSLLKSTLHAPQAKIIMNTRSKLYLRKLESFHDLVRQFTGILETIAKKNDFSYDLQVWLGHLDRSKLMFQVVRQPFLASCRIHGDEYRTRIVEGHGLVVLAQYYLSSLFSERLIDCHNGL